MVSAVSSLIEVTDEAGAVAELRFNRPEALNVIDVSMAQAFKAQVDQLVRRPTLQVLLISGAGRAFMAGGDLKAFARLPVKERARLSWQIINPIHDALITLAESPLITIALVHGAVAGAGMSITLGTDLALASAEATFNFAYAKVAVSPDCGGSYWLPRVLGSRRALEIALLSDTLSAETALQWGLINRVTENEQELRSVSRAMAERLSVGPARAYAATKRLLRQSGMHSLREQLDRERDSFMALSAEAEFDAALQKFFSAKAGKPKRSEA